MKRTINENGLNKIIAESIQRNLAEYKLRQTIKNMVRESIDNMMDYNMPYEEKDSESDADGKTLDDLGLGDLTLDDLGLDTDDLDDMDVDYDENGKSQEEFDNDWDADHDENGDYVDDDDEDTDAKRRKEKEDSTGLSQIEKYFDKPGVDNAPFAYKLFGVTPEDGKDTNDMKNARRKFSAKKNHSKNDNGYSYGFTPAEKNELENMISSAGLSEAKINESINKAFKKVLK